MAKERRPSASRCSSTGNPAFAMWLSTKIAGKSKAAGTIPSESAPTMPSLKPSKMPGLKCKGGFEDESENR